MPEVYYGLTATETAALLQGVQDRELSTLRQTRILATLLRNAHFKGAVTEREYMPLPGDEELVATASSDNALSNFMMLANAMGGEITIEKNA